MLPPLVRRTDVIRLLTLGDDALAVPTPDDTAYGEILRQYFGGEDLDVSRLRLVEGSRPTWFHVHPLTEHELALCDVEGAASVAHKAYEILRLALVEVDHLDGWTPERHQWCGVDALTLACVEMLPRHAVRWLAGIVWKLSTLADDIKKSSGSSPGTRTGDGPTASESSAAPTTAATIPSSPDGVGATRSVKSRGSSGGSGSTRGVR